MGAMSGKRIVVAVDGSETAREALRFALQMAPDLRCSVTAVIAVQTRMPGYRAGYFSFVDRHILSELKQFAAGVAEQAKQIAKDAGDASLETEILEGDKEIFEQIVDFVASVPETAFLVMGSYGHGVRDRLILGSTTQRLILEIARRQMGTPVFVVP
ncbi:MAG: UspA protein [Acidobacteria bacterium]|nr:UspA protein [Acidobacteriota bacterium]